MSDPLEDPDGAPYPEEVQTLRSCIREHAHPDAYLPEAWDELLVEALESVVASVATDALEHAQVREDALRAAGNDWMARAKTAEAERDELRARVAAVEALLDDAGVWHNDRVNATHIRDNLRAALAATTGGGNR